MLLQEQKNIKQLGLLVKSGKRKHKQFFDKLSYKKLERTAYVKFIL